MSNGAIVETVQSSSYGIPVVLGTAFGFHSRMISVAVGGDLTVVWSETGTATTITVPAGVFPIRCTTINASGTTATGLAAYK